MFTYQGPVKVVSKQASLPTLPSRINKCNHHISDTNHEPDPALTSSYASYLLQHVAMGFHLPHYYRHTPTLLDTVPSSWPLLSDLTSFHSSSCFLCFSHRSLLFHLTALATLLLECSFFPT